MVHGGGRIKNQGRGIDYDKDKVIRVQNIRYNSLFIVYIQNHKPLGQNIKK
jgi:hypothetical protein